MNEAPPLPPGYELATPKAGEASGRWLRAYKRLEDGDTGWAELIGGGPFLRYAEDPKANQWFARPKVDFWNVEPMPKDIPPEDPKGEAGKTKDQLQLIPPVFNSQVAKALACGAAKYGPWNWREHKVEMMTYLGAMKRHIDQVIEREDIDSESQAHHLGHVAAGCAIVLDAMQHGTLIDNRPTAGRKLEE